MTPEARTFTIEALWISGRTVAEIATALKVSRGAVSGIITRSSLPNRSEMTADERRDLLLQMKASRKDDGALDRFDWVARYAAHQPRRVR